MSSASDLYVSLEFTPNPNTLKYSVNRQLLDHGARNFLKLEEAQAKSPLAAKLFGIPGIAAVMIGRDFVTVTKTEAGDWDLVHKSVSSSLEQHLGAGEPVFAPGALEAEAAGLASVGSGDQIQQRIQEILDREIRPAVAMDGGDITFDRFEAGVVYLHMQGSCSGCPSSTMTLKAGIETRLREAIPEIQSVEAV